MGFCLGKSFLERVCFAFEVQEVDYSPSEIKRLIAKEEEIERECSGGYDCDDFCQDWECLDCLPMFKAMELVPKHSLQIKFDDIVRIHIAGDAVTLHLSSTPGCYIEPAGETSCGNMEVGEDITGGAKTFVFFTDVPPPASTCGGSGRTEVPFSKVQEMVMGQSSHLLCVVASNMQLQL